MTPTPLPSQAPATTPGPAISSPEVNIKATPIRAMLKLMDRELSPSAREAVFTRIAKEFPEYEKKMRAGQILASDRVPLTLVNHLTEAVAEQLGVPLIDFARRAGALGAEEAVNSVLKILMAFISPQKLLDKAAVTWKSLYDRGDLVVKHDDCSADVELRDFPVISAAGCGRITGWMEWLGAKSGGKNLSVRHYACSARNDATCKWDIHWEN